MVLIDSCLLFLVLYVPLCSAQFEKKRCHCICDSSKFDKYANITAAPKQPKSHRQVYVANKDSSECKCEFVVLPQLDYNIPTEHVAEFCEAYCNCKYQVRNILVIQIGVFLTVILVAYLSLHLIIHSVMKLIHKRDERTKQSAYKRHFDETTDISMDPVPVAVIGVICIISVLVIYMVCLVCLEPLLRHKKGLSRYQAHFDELDDNIFSDQCSTSGNVMQLGASVTRRDVAQTSSSDANLSDSELQPKSHAAGAAGGSGILSRVNAKKDKWMNTVQEQRKTIFKDHSVLN